MASSAPLAKAPLRAPAKKISLPTTIPVRIMSLDAVFREFVDAGRVDPDENKRFCEYVLDLTPFVQKEPLILSTARIPPFEEHEIKALDRDALHLEHTLNSYLKYTAKSDYSSFVAYERFIPNESVAARMRLSVQLYQPGEKQQPSPPQGPQAPG